MFTSVSAACFDMPMFQVHSPGNHGMPVNAQLASDSSSWCPPVHTQRPQRCREVLSQWRQRPHSAAVESSQGHPYQHIPWQRR